MKYLVWVDGCIVENSSYCSDEPYVMQRIHTLAYRAYDVEKHLELLRAVSERLFGFASLCSDLDAEDIIRQLLIKARVTPSFSCPVAMRLNCRGELSFAIETPTFGAGMYLRAKRYEAVAVVCDRPLTNVETSVTVTYDSMMDAHVKIYGGDYALWMDRERNLISRAWMPIFVVYRNRVYTPERHMSVEFERCECAIRALGLELVVQDISESSLSVVDEIFFVDIMGVSAFSKIGDHRLLSSVSNRVAGKMVLV